jgi:hypothetical protein
VPVGDFDELRADVGSAPWRFDRREPDGAYSREALRIRRAMLTVVRLERRNCSPVRLMAGYGVGLYSYRVDGSSVRKAGVHGLIGVDVQISDRTALAGEIALHAFGGPRLPSVTSGILVGLRTGFGVRIRL